MLLRSCLCARALAIAILAAWLVAAHAPVRAQAQELVLAVSEGTSGGTDHAQVIAKYGDVAQVIGTAIKQPVHVVFVREFGQLDDGMKSGRFAFVMARPSDSPARGIRDYGYRFVASARPEGQCMLYVSKGSPITTLEQAKGKRFVMPEKVSYMAQFCTAELRDRGLPVAAEKVQYVREQAAVKFYLDNKFGDVGAVASYSGARKDFDKDGAVLIHRSVSQPFFPLIASRGIAPAQIAAVQKALLQMKDTPAGQATLQRIGIKDFDVTTEPRLGRLLDWLKV